MSHFNNFAPLTRFIVAEYGQLVPAAYVQVFVHVCFVVVHGDVQRVAAVVVVVVVVVVIVGNVITGCALFLVDLL
jgi:hypothetical protein